MAGEWDGARVRTWLDARVAAARAEQAIAARAGRSGEDDGDKASAEEMVCSLLRPDRVTATQDAFADAIGALQDRDDYVWRGVSNDARFDRHVRSLLKKLLRMTRANAGFENLARYQ